MASWTPMIHGTPEERAMLQRQAHAYVGTAVTIAGVFFTCLLPVFFGAVGGEATLFWLLTLAGVVVGGAAWILGCAYGALAKGYSILLGVAAAITVVGFLVLLALPDRWRSEPPEPFVPPRDGFPPLQE